MTTIQKYKKIKQVHIIISIMHNKVLHNYTCISCTCMVHVHVHVCIRVHVHVHVICVGSLGVSMLGGGE